ncbi:hypothetical protein N665_0225s0004 [Sinapis alba]|nr:hypothetical protein N665_0225s0004 [Sinapis alba]
MPQVLSMIWMILCVHLICISSQQETMFIYNGFHQADLYTDGFVKVLPEGQLQLTDGSGQNMGHAFFKKPFEFASPESLSFSTHFVCALVPKPGFVGGHGIAFIRHNTWDLNISTQGSSSSHLVAIEIDTALSSEFDDKNANHVGIDVNSLISIDSPPAAYFSEIQGKNESIMLLSEDPIQVWVDYGGNVLNVSLAPVQNQKPKTFPGRKIFLGFSGATGTLISYQYILGWSFSGNMVSLHHLDATKLPRRGMTRRIWSTPFFYKTLYNATKGFQEDGLLGKGGFGEVYKGTLSCNAQIEVKRVSHDADDRMKQFVAEIVSMGNLKHKNIVPLLGYCRRKGELLLVSEYMPNGSLDHYLFHDDKPPFSWSRRLVIIKDIASALCYIHTEAPQVVLHRDIKDSNVMLDAEFNGWLGEFGMARFHDDGADTATTVALGTIGYMAPELTTTRASTATDVYGFCAFLLEVTCGRRPVDPALPEERRYLVKWVSQCWEMAYLLGARDPSMRGEISYEEVEMVLKVGLLCTNSVVEMRPSIEEVVQYLNERLKLPDISPNSLGIGSFAPFIIRSNILLASHTTKTFYTSFYSSSSGNDSAFVTHSIINGHGR